MRMKMRRISLVLAVMMVVISVSVPVMAMDTLTDNEVAYVRNFFEKNATVYSKTGEDMTERFFADTMADYQAGRYDVVLDYIYENVGSAKAQRLVESNTATFGARDYYTVEFWNVHVYIDEEIHKIDNHNQLGYYYDVSFWYNSNTLEVVDVEPAHNFEYFGYLTFSGSQPGFELTTNTAEVNEDHTEITYGFTIHMYYHTYGVVDVFPYHLHFSYHISDGGSISVEDYVH